MAEDLLTFYRVLTVPGLHGSGPDHWQSRWERLHPRFERVRQRNWHEPDLHAWSQRVDAQRAQGDDGRPVLLVAHSFGCLAAVASVAREPELVAGLLLVAPADPEKFGLSCALPARALRCPSTMIASTDDPWMTVRRAAHWAMRWGSRFINAGPLGHINADSGLNDWPEGLQYLHAMAERAHHAPLARIRHKQIKTALFVQ